MSAILHGALALALSLFLGYQARSLALVLRERRLIGAGRRPTDLVWAAIPLLLVLFLAARSWMAVLDLPHPAVAGQTVPRETPRAALAPSPR